MLSNRQIMAQQNNFVLTFNNDITRITLYTAIINLTKKRAQCEIFDFFKSMFTYWETLANNLCSSAELCLQKDDPANLINHPKGCFVGEFPLQILNYLSQIQ